MAFKTILLPIRESSTALSLMETAISMAIRNQGHLDLLYVQNEPNQMVPLHTMGLSQSMRDSIVESAQSASNKQINDLKDNFAALCEKYDVSMQPRASYSGEASADFLVENGRRDELIGKFGRLADLIIVPQPLRTKPPPSSFEAALRDTGRPVLMVQREKVLENPGKILAIGWNASKEAAQAISSMQANLKRADKVFVLSSEKRMQQAFSANDACEYLNCHGITAEPVSFNTAHQSVGEALLNKSVELECDRLIVGGYSHARIRDVIMGGVTGYLLAAAKIPVIFVH